MLGRVAQSVTCPNCRYVSDCRFEGDEFDPFKVVFVDIDNEKISVSILFFPLIQEWLLSVTSESMCTKYWLTT